MACSVTWMRTSMKSYIDEGGNEKDFGGCSIPGGEAMNTNELRATIETSFCTCAQCEERIDAWPDADESEPDKKIIFVAQSKLFVGICPNGHVNEWTLARAKAGETAPEDVTVRTLGRFVKQEDCTHGRRAEVDVPAGKSVPTAEGMIEGPAKIWVCGWCLRRERLTAKNKKSGIILP